MSPIPIAYFTTRFPVRSETAVIREMHELEAAGYRISVFSLKRSDFGIIHDPKADAFRERIVDITPGLLVRAAAGHLTHILTLDRNYFRTLGQTLRGGGRHLPKLMWLFIAAPGLAAAAQRLGARYVHANFASYQAYAAWVVHRLTGIPYGFTMHAHDIFLHRFMMQEKAADAALVASISTYNTRFLRESDGIAGEQIHVVRCGVDLSEFPYVARTSGGDPFRVLAVGRLQETKGFVHLVRASALLRGHFGFQVEIVGEGPEHAALEAEIRSAGIATEVRILQRVGHAELLQAYRTADAFVLPCQQLASGTMDGIPATLMEAMASGMPVISTGISGIPELVEDGVTGLVVPPSDPPALARAITRLRAEPDLRQRLAREGRRRVEESFDIRSNAAGLARRIGEIVAREGRGAADAARLRAPAR